MTKAKKGLIITLFAAMMVFAFGATSAFATPAPTPADEATWDLQNHTVTVDEQTYGGVEVYFVTDGENYHGYPEGTTVAVAPEEANVADKVFYDLEGSSIDSINGADTKSNYSYSDYSLLYGNVTVTLVKPAYATKVVPANTTETSAKLVALQGWTLTAEVAELEESTTTQTGTISVKYSTAYGVDRIDKVGEVKALSVFVQPDGFKYLKPTKMRAIDYAHYDEHSGNLEYKTVYNGEAQVITASEVNGWTIAYEKFNTTTGNWDALNGEITVKDVADTGNYRAVYTKGSNKVYVEADIEINPANTIIHHFEDYDYDFEYGFDSALILDRRTALFNGAYVKVPAEAVARDFVVSNAFDVDATEAMGIFDEVFDVKTTVNAADATKETWEIKAKPEMAEAKNVIAVMKKHEAFVENYGLAYVDSTSEILDSDGVVAKVQREAAVDPNTQFDDITFTFAPNATYKVKKAKSLKKTKSFTVEAVAKSGNAISYQLTTPNKKISIDPATGKITVKKGLKKGTYKVTVKALTEAGNGYRAAKESVQLTIKIKK